MAIDPLTERVLKDQVAKGEEFLAKYADDPGDEINEYGTVVMATFGEILLRGYLRIAKGALADGTDSNPQQLTRGLINIGKRMEAAEHMCKEALEDKE